MMDATSAAARPHRYGLEQRPQGPAPSLEPLLQGRTLRVVVRGDWPAAAQLPAAVVPRVPDALERVEIVLEDGARVDARTLARIRGLLARLDLERATLDFDALPAGMRRLLELALAVPQRQGAAQAAQPHGLERAGTWLLAALERQRAVLAFVGEIVLGIAAFASARARYRRADLGIVVEQVSAGALPIVSLVAFLFGAVLAFIGSLQLRPFGAQAFVANLVGSGMALEMGALITAVVMAGRAGAAFAAQLGTMQVNEEIDALEAMGLKPIEFLVVPRIVALALMSPLLVLYADALGILGGMVVAAGMLDISPAAYFTQMLQYLEADQLVKGLVKGFVFGTLIAIAGCLRGMQCGRSAQAVGEATTSAVVTSIVAIVVADSIITVLIFELDL